MVAHEIVKSIRAGNAVRRWHTQPVIKQETVGEHSANVLALVFALCNPAVPSTNLVIAALTHDAAEQWTGDVPATAKWEWPHLSEELDAYEKQQRALHHIPEPELTEEELRTLKWADMLDLCYFCLSEMRLGNINMKVVFDRGIDYLQRCPPLNATSEGLLTQLRQERYHV